MITLVWRFDTPGGAAVGAAVVAHLVMKLVPHSIRECLVFLSSHALPNAMLSGRIVFCLQRHIVSCRPASPSLQSHRYRLCEFDYDVWDAEWSLTNNVRPRVVTHHRRNGDLLTIAQEEIILIAAFGLLWFGTFPRRSPTLFHALTVRRIR